MRKTNPIHNMLNAAKPENHPLVYLKNKFEYFIQFEKEDEQWHKKWKWRTIAFCVGSTMTSLLGICAAWAILLL